MTLKKSLAMFLLVLALLLPSVQGKDHLVFEGQGGPGKGKHIVFLAGDEEYRSEEAMPLMAQIMAKQGFKCTVLFSLDSKGNVDPNNQKSLSNPSALDSADSLVMSIRFRNWNDETMQKFENAINRGVSLIGLRTTTHAFKFPKDSKWQKYSFRAPKETGWHNGFGREIMGESWVSHHGKHKKEGTRTFHEKGAESNPILNSVDEIFGDTDVYGANPAMSHNTTILLRAGVTATLEPDSALVDAKNNPMQPCAWTREYKHASGTVNKVFTTTMGSSTDLADADLRRLVGNAVFWSVGLSVPSKLDVTLPGEFIPTFYSNNKFKKNTPPAGFVLKPAAPNTGKADGTANASAPQALKLNKDSRVLLIGGNLGSRMLNYGSFETELQLRNPEKNLFIRNMCDGGNTPGFRPHSSRKMDKHFAFPGADKFYADKKTSAANGFAESEDEWLTRLKADTIIAFFGYTESYRGEAGIANYKEELDAFIKHTLSQKYNGKAAPQLALVSPIAFQDLSAKYDYPNGAEQNANLALYTAAMKEVAAKNGVLFIDAYAPSAKWFSTGEELTIDGSQLNGEGYKKFANLVINGVFGKSAVKSEAHRKAVQAAVEDKNWYWHNDFKIPNGVHVNGRRYKPFGPANYPFEIKKIRQITAIRDQAIWSALKGQKLDIASLDAKTDKLPEVKTNYKPSSKNGSAYISGPESQKKLTLPEGYKMELFASEKEFPALANPVQMSFDNKGRLWVATMPSYPHWMPGDGKPKDKLLILEDTDGDYKADKQTIFADNLNLPIGFEFAPEGVYVTQGTNLELFRDTNGDDKADVREVILSGFDDHDTHHAISAFCADPSGAFLMGEGVFLNTSVETSYGTVRGNNGGFYRFDPVKRKLERTAQLSIPNPWGIAYDEFGQSFFLFTSGTSFAWMDPVRSKPKYGQNLRAKDILAGDKVRPTSGVEFVSSRHFPDEVQGDVLISNNIGYRGAKQHQIIEDGTGFKAKYRQDLFKSEDGNFRPVDLEFAPDGSLYVIDWHNTLIGHMQHNARDPYRDHKHGRVYRITYPSRPLVKPAKVAGASITELLENLKLPEYRTRYRTRRELRGRDAGKVLAATKAWAAKLNKSDKNYEKNLLEALYVTWGINKIDTALLNEALNAKDHKVRAAAVNVLRYNMDKVDNEKELLVKAAKDKHGRVVNNAMTTASWMAKADGQQIVTAAKANSAVMDQWNKNTLKYAESALNNTSVSAPKKKKVKIPKGIDKKVFLKGAEIYEREGHCGTCHQHKGEGLSAAGFPPLAGTKWVNGSEERLIKLTLKGLMGPIEVKGKKYPGMVPMTPFEGMLNDKDIAAVLTYVRISFGNKAPAIKPETVKKVRAEVKSKQGFFSAKELLKMHPHK
ncbi:MAG: ThuA domain-containing protein [Lentisphaerales bacterium]|nr:ThuA domain-containing protein [Lentisphaerales bacterium]